MRIFNFKKILISFLFFTLILCNILGFSNNSAVFAAEQIPDYFYVRQYTTYNGPESPDNIFVNIGDGEVAYVSASNVVEAKLYYETESENPIKSITPFVKLNGQTISNEVLNTYSLELEYNTVMFKLNSIFNDETKKSPYGKYEIILNYIIEIDDVQLNKSISYSYYIVKDSDYYNGRNANVQINNISLVEKDNISQVYDRVFQYNYSLNYSNKLPTLSFNKFNLNVEISKTFQKTTSTQKIWFDGTSVQSSNNLVLVKENPDNNVITLTFNDLGTYSIKYNFTYYNGQTVENINPAVSIFTNVKRADLIEIFGYQLYYSDSQTTDLKEFKTITDNNEIGLEITDISYIYTQFNKSLDNKQEEIINAKQDGAEGYSGVLEKLNNKELTIQQTNQAPVQFKYNVEIFTEANDYENQSKFWKISETHKIDAEGNPLYDAQGNPIYEYTVNEGEVYDNRPLSESGIYLINIIYKYYPTIISSDEACESSSTSAETSDKLRSQWFLFRITKDTAKMSITTEENTYLADESFTNTDVTVKKLEDFSSVFNATTQLDLYFQKNYVGAYEKIATIGSNEEFVATENGNYEVKMLFGKNLTRSYSSTFTIDKESIDNIQVFSVDQYSNSNLYYRSSEIEFATNQPVSVSWNNKASSSVITAKYKFIPLVYANSAFNSSILEQFYKTYNSVPTDYYFDFINSNTYEYSELDYINTQNLTNIPSGNVLSQAGMYIFKLSDTAGNENYFSFVIDNSPARILQKVKDTFIEPTSLNILSSDVTVVWGQYKVSQFMNLTYSSGRFVIYDEWINKIFNETDIFDKYFEMMTISTANQFFISSKIDSNVLVSIDGEYSWILDADSYEIKFLDEDKTEALEHDYSFYTRDELNTKQYNGADEVSIKNYVNNYSATHRIKISSDASLSELVYTTKGELTSLYQDSFNKSSTETINKVDYSKKDKYFIPTTVKTLQESNEILKFIFNPTPEPGVIEIDTVTYKFSPFKEAERKDARNNIAYTYEFIDYSLSEELTIYSKNEPAKNMATVGTDGFYTWKINEEYNSINSSYQTKAGKYTITRKYANLSDTITKVNESHDYMIRSLTFIIDRNGIITSPVLTESSTTKLYSYVGEAIQLQVLEEDPFTMFFEDIYLAINNVSSNTPILETNKLPVFVWVPTYKYGYSYNNNPNFYTEDSIIYYDESVESLIKTYSLSAEIKYSKELASIDQSKIIYESFVQRNDSHLRFKRADSSIDENDSISGRAFKEVGYYKVIIKQGHTSYGQNEFSYIFRIKSGEPSFKVNNISNNRELPIYNQNYYTNQEVVRLYWENPTSLFEAKIDINKIYYSINNEKESYLIDKSLIKTLNNVNTIDLNLKDIGAYYHGAKINISMQFEGKEADYNVGSFKKTKTIVIDTQAPQKNINNLVSLSGIDSSLVRNSREKYNTSVSNGLYKYYSFAVDVSVLENIIDFTSYQNGEAYSMYYRPFVIDNQSTKYNSVYQQESLPSEIENSLSNFTLIQSSLVMNDLKNNSNLYNRYIEIVEKDLAGNITIYTIYLTNMQAMQEQIAIEYNINNETVYLTYSELKHNSNIYAKSSFEIKSVKITDFAWNKIIINNVTYLKTPYSNNFYYNLSTYDDTNPSSSETSLSNFAVLSPKSKIQYIYMNLVPLYNDLTFNVSVLNTSLSVIHTTETNLYSNEEGILIKLPSNASDKDAKIYATLVEVNQYVKDVHNNDVKDTLYYLNSPVYFSKIQEELSSPPAITLSYVNYLGNTYIKVRITAPVPNRFYTYTVVDNFNDNYPVTSIYGSEQIEKELYSYYSIVENYENGELYHYSTHNTFFKYNSAKDKITLTISTTNFTGIYDFSKQSDIDRFNTSGYGKLSQPVGDSVVYTVEMYAPTIDMSSGIVGSEIAFTINKFIAIEDISSGFAYDKINLIIYNIIPTINLYGIQNELLNELFNKGTMYGHDIKISISNNTGRIPCIIYLVYEDETREQIVSDKIVSKPGNYTLEISYTSIFSGFEFYFKFTFTISNNEEDFYKVVYNTFGQSYYATPTGKPFSYTDGTKTHSIETHYIINTTDFNIVYNSEQGIEAISVVPIKYNGYDTYLYTLSNKNSPSATSFFNRTIAITVIPYSTNILRNFSYYENEGNPILLEGELSSFVVGKNEANIGYKRISWQSFYGIPENTITAKIYYGDNLTLYNANQKTENNITWVDLTASGTYYFEFLDKAGNVHRFNNLTSIYTIRYLRSVIYYVNGSSPINNAIYDNKVTINIPSSTSKYYDSNAQPKINVLKNGQVYNPESDKSNRTFTFTEAGLYKVWFSASVTNSKTDEVTYINEEPLYFLIINPKESRWAFDLSEYGDYYVKQIIRNGLDVTESFTNVNMGKLTYKTVIENNIPVQKAYLKNLLISVNDAVTGRGEYTVTVATDNEFNQEFTFSFWINNTTPAIQVSIPENTETIDTIKISFNTADLLEDIGDCVLKVSSTGKDTTIINLNEKLFAEGKLQSVYNLTIDSKGTYYIQLFSESGKLLYSYRVIKNEPLNAVSIIVIIVSSVVVVGLIIVFVALRKKMKIR